MFLLTINGRSEVCMQTFRRFFILLIHRIVAPYTHKKTLTVDIFTPDFLLIMKNTKLGLNNNSLEKLYSLFAFWNSTFIHIKLIYEDRLCAHARQFESQHLWSSSLSASSSRLQLVPVPLTESRSSTLHFFLYKPSNGYAWIMQI